MQEMASVSQSTLDPIAEEVTDHPESNDGRDDDAVQTIGKGYNLVTNKSAPEDIFECETRCTDFGIVVPSSAKSGEYRVARVVAEKLLLALRRKFR